LKDKDVEVDANYDVFVGCLLLYGIVGPPKI